MDFLGIAGGILKTVGGIFGIGGAVDIGEKILSGEIPPEKKVELQAALLQHEKDMKQLEIEEMRVAISESLAEIQSSDKFVSRARPFGVYAASLITAAMAGALIFQVKIDPTAIVTLLTPLWGSAAYYTFNRTKEKMNGSKDG